MGFSWQVMTLGGLALSTLGVALLLGILLWGYVMQRMGQAETLKELPLLSLFLGGLLLARLGYVLVHFEQYQPQPLSLLDIRDGGLYLWLGWGGVLLWVLWRYRPHSGSLTQAGGASVILPDEHPGHVTELQSENLQGTPSEMSGKTPSRILSQSPLKVLLSLSVVVALVLAGVELGRARHTPLASLPGVELIQNGTPTDLARLIQAANAEGKVVVVNAWASWCPPCRKEMPAFVAVQQTRQDARFLLLNQQEAAAVVSAFLQREGIDPALVFLDTQGALLSRFKLHGLPSTLFFNTRGEWVKTHVGSLNEAALNIAIDQIVQEDAHAR